MKNKKTIKSSRPAVADQSNLALREPAVASAVSGVVADEDVAKAGAKKEATLDKTTGSRKKTARPPKASDVDEVGKHKRPTFADFKKRAMQNEEFKAEYERLKPEFDLLKKFIIARKKAALSQKDLALKLDLQQPAIARLERGGYMNTSVANLSQVADALGYSIKISLEPKRNR